MRVLLASLMGLVSTTLVTASADGAEIIFFRTSETEVQISRQDFEALAETGVLPPDIQPIMGPGLLAPQLFQELLSRPIRLPTSVDKFLDSATGEFILGQLATLIDHQPNQETESISLIRSAFTRAAQNQQLSFLELIRQYPQEEVRVDLTGLERTYQQVVRFAEKVQSDVDGTRQILADLFCSCQSAASDSMSFTKAGTFSPFQPPCHRTQAHPLSSQHMWGTAHE